MTDKGKAPIQKIQSSKDYEMKTSKNQNRFQLLSPEFPPIPYVIAAQNPFNKTQTSTSLASPAPKTMIPSSSQNPVYFTKKNPEFLFMTTYTEVPDYRTLCRFLNIIFPQGCHWIPEDPIKNQKFYELVLVDSGSVELQHTMDKFTPEKISFSKCTIKKVIKPSEWATYSTTKDFSVNYIPRGYSYYDYLMAWHRAFLFRPFDHSWFFQFSSECPTDFPIWFYDWFQKFGSTINILPEKVLKGYLLWISKSKGAHYQKELLFYKEFRVAWIFCWSYRVGTNPQYEPAQQYPLCLFRDCKIKWWDKFIQDICSEESVLDFIQTGRRYQLSIKAIQAAQQRIEKLEKIVEDPNAGASQILELYPKNKQIQTPLKQEKSRQLQKQEIQSDDDDDDDAMEQFIAFQKFRKMQKKLKSIKGSDSPASSSASYNPMGGPCTQDPF